MELNTLLVPVDFSETSYAAAQQAVRMAVGEDCAVILLHVLDRHVLELAQQHQWGTPESLSAQMRSSAEAEFAKLTAALDKSVEVQTVICEGSPFVEIIKKAEEFQVDAVLMGKHGLRGRAEKMMFGSTAERVIRWSTRPVVVLPPVTPPASEPPASEPGASESPEKSP